MARYRYKTWGGRLVLVDAYTVVFRPEHVVFEDVEGRIVHAEDNTNVRQLTNEAASGTVVMAADGESRRLLPPPKES